MSSTPQWNSWYESVHQIKGQPRFSDDLECDSTVEDNYDEDSGQIEAPPLDGGFFCDE